MFCSVPSNKPGRRLTERPRPCSRVRAEGAQTIPNSFFSEIYLSLASSDIRKCVLNEIHAFCLIRIRWCYFCLLLMVVLLILLVKVSWVPWLLDPLEMRRNWEAGPEGFWGGPVSTSGAKTKNYGSIPTTSKIDEFASFRSTYSKSIFGTQVENKLLISKNTQDQAAKPPV